MRSGQWFVFWEFIANNIDKFFEICGDSVLIFLIDLFSNLLVSDVRINLHVVLLFLFVCAGCCLTM